MTDPVMLLSQVHGEGRITYRALKEAGYDTLESVARAEVHVLADQARLNAVTALRLKSGAQHMMGRVPVDGAAPSSIPAAPEQAHREERIGMAERSAGARLSEGVLAEEAVLLEGPSRQFDPSAQSAARAHDLHQHPVDREPGDPQSERPVGPAGSNPPHMPDISAAAHAAAALPHASAQAPPSAGPTGETVEPPRRSFWRFGGPA